MNTKRVTEEMIRNVPEPTFTETWHPVSHAKVLDCLEHSVRDAGLGIVTKNYSIRGEGSQMFGTWQLDQKTNGTSWVVGFRNSVDKAFAVGITAGTHVVVCDNLAFSGEFVEFRRHTKCLDMDELKLVANRSVKTLIGKLEVFTDWQENLKHFNIEDLSFKALTFDAMKSGVFPPSKFIPFLNCYDEEIKEVDSSLYTFHGAVTRLLRDSSLFTISERNKVLVEVLDNHMAS